MEGHGGAGRGMEGAACRECHLPGWWATARCLRPPTTRGSAAWAAPRLRRLGPSEARPSRADPKPQGLPRCRHAHMHIHATCTCTCTCTCQRVPPSLMLRLATPMRRGLTLARARARTRTQATWLVFDDETVAEIPADRIKVEGRHQP